MFEWSSLLDFGRLAFGGGNESFGLSVDHLVAGDFDREDLFFVDCDCGCIAQHLRGDSPASVK